jgi:hypothetical protein
MNRADAQREAILTSDDLKREPVDVPWEMGGEKLYVRELQASERDTYLAETIKKGEFAWRSNLTATVLVKCIVNEDGERIFADSDADALGAKGTSVLAKLFKVAMRLSAMEVEAAEAIKADFGPAQSGNSDSG